MKNGKYDENGKLLSEYLPRTITLIKKRRTTIINDYKSKCLADVSACLTQNNYQTYGLRSGTINACMSVITTCKSAQGDDDIDDVRKWLQDVGIASIDNTNQKPDTTTPGTEPDDNSDKEPVPYNPPASTLPPPVTTNDAELLTIKQQDEEKCLSIDGGRISASGTMCVIWNNPGMLDTATSYGWAHLLNWDLSQSAYAGKQSYDDDHNIIGTAELYVMKWAYQKALSECQAAGGTLSIAPGEKHSNAHAFCNTEFPAGQMTEEECASKKMVWPTGFGDQFFGGELHNSYTVNGKPVKQTCDFISEGLYYVGRDLPGQCLPGMEVVPGLGSCTCKPGLYYESAYKCSPNGKLFKK